MARGFLRETHQGRQTSPVQEPRKNHSRRRYAQNHPGGDRRPTDFLQKQLVVTYPIDQDKEEDDDPDFSPPAEAAQLRTRKEAEQALRTSVDYVEKFWQVWRDSYLTSLREQHKKYLDQGKSTPKTPQEAERSRDGEVRQVELRMTNGRITRRPISSLIPLELGEEDGQEMDYEERQKKTEEEDSSVKPSIVDNTRPKRTINKYFPYHVNEYDINTLYLDVDFDHNRNLSRCRMEYQKEEEVPPPQSPDEPEEDIEDPELRKAAEDLLEELDEKKRFTEDDLQRRLEVVNDHMTDLIRRREHIEGVTDINGSK
ncbi:hypothetical protein OESDEN_06983 [Oesophagostomum dentatum]|uniref:DUF5641 domain-containing protein n=1 Tax=Oesophagostomum dentatum TaxID=61180 RepID=A0A0B1TCR3_OESDE|nr:hypothetical protein OESDEN_06983 [Oesophagostomum dentatum]